MQNKIKIAILGLGLIGSSILKGLINKNYEFFVFSMSGYQKALKDYPFIKASDNLEILKEADIVFVCSKVEKTLYYLEKLNDILDEKTVVADVCSIKKDLLNKKYNYNFILSHPMAGSEKRGYSAGDGELFLNSKWLYGKENEILIKIIKDLGAKPILIDMNEHDKLTAQISHLPTILSFLLFQSAQNEAKLIASSGFRDMTRLAMTNCDISKNMFDLNRENILEAFDKVIKNFDDLKKMNDDEKIKLFEEINLKRKEMYDDNGKNIFQI